ncbi:MAG: CRISPR-associated endonuclease Cas3'' [Lachnospiraceae bacterium]
MMYLAHSARDDCPEQSYQEHIENVYKDAMKNATEVSHYAALDGELLLNSIEIASYFHDMGKLHVKNQEILHKRDNHAPLDIHHQDAGVAYLKQIGASEWAQMVVSSHHSGLPNIQEEYKKEEKNIYRDKDIEIRKIVDKELTKLSRLQEELIPDSKVSVEEKMIQGDEGVFSRILLSCLVDADHTDTARHYKKYPQKQEQVLLKPNERLKKLDAYVKTLCTNDERSSLRSKMYAECRNSNVDENIVACNSPVGSGKTTAVMAYLLQQAMKKKARRIFVVLPFTNIIRQSVDVYRKALVLPGENPEEVVAELHHKADFEDEDVRALTSQWRAPIIVTTSVAFFETMASCMPAALRRMHELPGSIIFVDEAHAALPVKLLPITWKWIKILAEQWNCSWVLASGSLVEFWKIQELTDEIQEVPQIVSQSLIKRLMQYEENRIKFCYASNALSRKELLEKIVNAPGPRLVIMNTVQNAAVIAMDLMEYYGEEHSEKVMHLSTALDEEDKEKTIEKVKERLKDKDDEDWVLVATSCVEAGVDFSFRTGFRQIASLLSLLQAAGRINRNGIYEDAEIWSFRMQDDSKLTDNKNTKDSEYVLKKYFEKDTKICPQLSTKAIRDELLRNTTAEEAEKILKAENDFNFPDVKEKYKIIDQDTVLVVADEKLKNQIRYGGCDWGAIQRKAIPVYKYRIKQLNIQPLAEGIYDWDLEYDSFIGIMKGILMHEDVKSGFLMI